MKIKFIGVGDYIPSYAYEKGDPWPCSQCNGRGNIILYWKEPYFYD